MAMGIRGRKRQARQPPARAQPGAWVLPRANSDLSLGRLGVARLLFVSIHDPSPSTTISASHINLGARHHHLFRRKRIFIHLKRGKIPTNRIDVCFD